MTFSAPTSLPDHADHPIGLLVLKWTICPFTGEWVRRPFVLDAVSRSDRPQSKIKEARKL